MDIREVLATGKRKLLKAGIDSYSLDAEVILSYVLHTDRLDLFINYDRVLNQKQLSKYDELLELRCQHMPVAYITGEKEFYGIKFYVSPGVLIPRPETEFLVERSLEVISKIKEPKLADICCGSGAIAVAVASNNKCSTVYASDISQIAGCLTKKNATRHNVNERVFFMQGDFWEPFKANKIEELDLIISNPPYIPTSQIKELPPDVSHEPKLALDGGEDGLEAYRHIICDAPVFLKTGGQMILEIGWNQAKTVSNMLKSAGFSDIYIQKDYAGFDRVVSAIYSQ